MIVRRRSAIVRFCIAVAFIGTLMAACRVPLAQDEPKDDSDLEPFHVAAPVLNIQSGTYSTDQMLVITCPTAEAELRYTLDETPPAAMSTLYTGPIAIAGHGTRLTVRVAAFVEDRGRSNEIAVTIAINYNQVSSPSFSILSTQVEFQTMIWFACSDTDVEFRYTTDGSDPIESGISGDSILCDRPMTIKLIATKEGMQASEIVSRRYDVRLPEPSLSIASGAVAIGTLVHFGNAVSDVSFRFTTDGADPGADSPSGASAGIDEPCTLKVVATKTGWVDSVPVSAAYQCRLSAPTLSHPSGTVPGGQRIDFGNPTAGTSFRYTSDGSEPGSGSTSGTHCYVTSSPFNLKVRAEKAGWLPSEATSATYTVNLPEAPRISSVEFFHTGSTEYTQFSTRIRIDPVPNCGSYEIEYSENGGAFQLLTETFTAELTTPYILREGIRYSFRVRARNVAGYSAYSPATTPTAAGLKSPTISFAYNALNTFVQWWDYSAYEDTYIIYRGLTEGTMVQIHSTGVGIAGSDGSQGIYTDTTAESGVTYFYAVRAYSNSLGVGSPLSGIQAFTRP